MIKTAITNKPNWKLAIGLPLFVFTACFIITVSSPFKSNPALLSNAVVLDLLITAPLLYFFVIRKTTVSKLTVVRVFIAGLLIAGLILNTHSNTLLYCIKTWVSPVVEAAVIFTIGRKFYLANKRAKQAGKSNIDFLTHCRMVMYQVTGNEKAGNILSSEIAVLYYAFLGRKDRNIDYKSKFTGYKENGILLVLATFLSLFLIETIGGHFLLSLWNPTAAWILTGLSFYTCIQLYAHIKAVKARPVIINADSVEIHNGLAGDALIAFDNIEKIELTNKLPIDRDAVKIALIKGLENHNCVIYLKQPIQVTKIFGIKKWTGTVLFFVDRPKDFIRSLHAAM
jgi:hypothetical protein